jgi:hypothetical protein
VAEIMNFLQYLRANLKLSYSSIHLARSALSEVIKLENGLGIGTHPDICLYMKGLRNLIPPRPRYGKIWDANIVLNFLRKLSPARNLSLKDLTLKVNMLLLLVSGQRSETLIKLTIDELEITDSEYIFTVYSTLKQSRAGYRNPQIVLQKYRPDPKLCIYTYLTKYLKITMPLRHTSQLLISFQKPNRGVSTDTISRWAKIVMAQAGVDTSIFKSHSTRAASTSAAQRGGALLEDIMITAGWSKASTFAKFYNKPILNKANLKFQSAVLSSTAGHTHK